MGSKNSTFSGHSSGINSLWLKSKQLFALQSINVLFYFPMSVFGIIIPYRYFPIPKTNHLSSLLFNPPEILGRNKSSCPQVPPVGCLLLLSFIYWI